MLQLHLGLTYSLESRMKAKHLRVLSLLAGNLANYFRVVLKERPKEFKNELREFTK